jgi:hypothetical protein
MRQWASMVVGAGKMEGSRECDQGKVVGWRGLTGAWRKEEVNRRDWRGYVREFWREGMDRWV